MEGRVKDWVEAPGDLSPDDAAAEEQRLARRLAETMRIVGWFLTVVGAVELLGVLTGDVTSLLLGGTLLAVGRATVRAAAAWRRHADSGATQAGLRIRALGELARVFRFQYVGAAVLVATFAVIVGVAVVWRLSVGASVGVEQLTSSEELFEVFGQEAFALRFTGGSVACWVDVESDGVEQRVDFWPRRATVSNRDRGLVSTFVWTREPGTASDDQGTEEWRMAWRSGKCPAPWLALNVRRPGSPAVPPDTSDANCNWHTSLGGKSITLGSRRKGSGGRSSWTSKIRSPMPVGEDVTLKTIEEEWLDDSGEPYHKHELRVVCRAP